MQILLRAKWVIIGRAAAMAWLGFLVNDKDYALHIQSGFRIRTKEKILVANLDMLEPTLEIKKQSDFDWEKYDWEKKGNNYFDEWVNYFRKECRNGIVEKINISDFGDLTIFIDNGMIIEVFLNSSTNECWRFFERGADKHLIITGSGIEKDNED